MVVVVGLGNPDAKYEKTFHNVGFCVVDILAKKLGVKVDKKKFKALVGEGFHNGQNVLLVKPQTYMNLSGQCVVQIKDKFKDARILVVVDDVDLPRGQVRFRQHGSAGTHNGLRSIVAHIGQEFERVKVGIGRDEGKDLADFVLSQFDETEFKPILESAASEVLERI